MIRYFWILLLIPTLCFGAMPVNPSYVSPTGSGSSCTIGSPCALSYANTNVAAGDTVYLRGGTYDTHIFPANSGTSGNRIIYEAYAGETPIIINTTTTYSTYYHGIALIGKNYITIKGITVGPDTSNTMNRTLQITHGSTYNIIDTCFIYGNYNAENIRIWKGNSALGDEYAATHNRIYNTTIANNIKLYTSGGAVYEYMGLQIGDAAYDHVSGFNTIDRCIFYMGGHHNIETFTKNNIIRNNFIHQTPGLTNETGGTPAYTADSNGKYGHRNIQIYGSDGTNSMYNLVEGNKFGPSMAAPENDGGDGFTLTARGNIVRYNTVYGAQNNGILLKVGDSNSIATNNRIYNNTVFGSGRYENSPQWQGADLRWYVSSGTYGTANAIKNNIFYGGTNGDWAWGGYQAGIQANNTIINNWCSSALETACSGSGDPLFVDSTYPAITATQSSSDTDFSLSSLSSAINSGTSLTLANGSGSSSTDLIVDDALYFQDGTWGSGQDSLQADWIAIGTVDNVVQISSINYATNTITLANAVSWSDNDPVWLFKKSDGTQVLYGSAPDIGAYETTETASPATATMSGGSISGGSIR